MKAAYLVKREHLGTSNLRRFDLLVCDGSLDPQKIREHIKPSAEIYPAFSLVWLFGFGANESIFGQIRAEFNEDDLYPDQMGKHKDNRHFRMRLETYEKYAMALASTLSHEWDGIYLDLFTKRVMPWRQPEEFGEDLEVNQIQYAYCRRYLIERLRDLTRFKIIANVDAGFPDLLDGHAMEEHDRIPKYIAMGTLMNAKGWRNIAWFWDPPFEYEGEVMEGVRL